MPTHAPHAEAVGESGDHASDRILAHIGQLTRTLRDSMRELGLDKHVERAAEAVPDARDRLKYIADMTEQAAERVLSAIDVAQAGPGAAAEGRGRTRRALGAVVRGADRTRGSARADERHAHLPARRARGDQRD